MGVARMRERGMSRQDVRWLVAQGIRASEPTGSGTPQRWSCRGYLGGEEAKVIFIEDRHAITVVTVEWIW